jgi:hypothetical protein
MANATRHETNAEYHADHTSVSHSALETFLRSPALYRDIFVTGETPKAPPSPAMLLGSLVHTMVLEPDKIDTEYTIAPPTCRARSGKAWDATVEAAECSGTTPVLESHMAEAAKMREAVNGHSVAAVLLLEPGEPERPIRWIDPARLVACKCRPDWLVDSPKMPTALVVDLKTAEDPTPEGFAKAAANYGYHRQAAWYTVGVAGACEKPVRFVFVVVGKSEPYDVFVYELAIADVDMGHEQNDRALERLAECHKTGLWLAPGQDEIQILELPRWARGNDYE